MTLVTNVSAPLGHCSTNNNNSGEFIPIPLTGCSRSLIIVLLTSAAVET